MQRGTNGDTCVSVAVLKAVRVRQRVLEGTVKHWLTAGIREGRRGSLVFDIRYYVANNPDLARYTNEQALDHWLQAGVNEGRRGSADFWSSWYLQNNRDVAASVGRSNYAGAVNHFLTQGRNEGRQGAP